MDILHNYYSCGNKINSDYTVRVKSRHYYQSFVKSHLQKVLQLAKYYKESKQIFSEAAKILRNFNIFCGFGRLYLWQISYRIDKLNPIKYSCLKNWTWKKCLNILWLLASLLFRSSTLKLTFQLRASTTIYKGFLVFTLLLRMGLTFGIQGTGHWKGRNTVFIIWRGSVLPDCPQLWQTRSYLWRYLEK